MKQKPRRVLKLRQLRRQRDLTQAELGERVGLPRSAICAYEKGRRYPTVDVALKLATELGEPVEQLFEYVELAS